MQRSEQYAPEGSRLALVLALLALAHARPHVTRRVHGVRLCEPEVEAYQPEVEPSPPPLLFCMPPRWLRDGGRGGSGEVAARDGERVLDSRRAARALEDSGTSTQELERDGVCVV